jgi:aromatic ring hydroxylase
MALRTAKQCIESLRTGVAVYFRGQRVADVTTHPVISVAVNHAAIDYRLAEEPRHRALSVVNDGDGDYSRYYQIPRTPEDLLQRSALIELATAEGGTLVVLIKEIGSDALCGLMRVAASVDKKHGTEYGRRVGISGALPDERSCGRGRADGRQRAIDRSRRRRRPIPTSRAHRRTAKRRHHRPRREAHTSVSTNANELIVLPTSAGPGGRDYAVSFAVPLDTPGLVCWPPLRLAAAQGSVVEHPISARHKMMETTTVFDDVFVPWERVFLCGRIRVRRPLALAFVEHHRFTAISYKLPLVDALLSGPPC